MTLDDNDNLLHHVKTWSAFRTSITPQAPAMVPSRNFAVPTVTVQQSRVSLSIIVTLFYSRRRESRE